MSIAHTQKSKNARRQEARYGTGARKGGTVCQTCFYRQVVQLLSGPDADMGAIMRKLSFGLNNGLDLSGGCRDYVARHDRDSLMAFDVLLERLVRSLRVKDAGNHKGPAVVDQKRDRLTLTICDRCACR